MFIALCTSDYNKIKDNLLYLHSLSQTHFCDLELRPDGRVYWQNYLLGIHGSPTVNKKKTDRDITAVIMNCGDTAGNDQKLDSSVNREVSVADYFTQFLDFDFWLPNDISFTNSLAKQLQNRFWIYIPMLFQTNLLKTSGLLNSSLHKLTNSSLSLPKVFPQGIGGRETHLKCLIHGVLSSVATVCTEVTSKVKTETTKFLIANAYLSAYSDQKARLSFSRQIFPFLSEVAKKFDVTDILWGKDCNAFGVDFPTAEKYVKMRFVLRYIPILIAFALTGWRSFYRATRTNIMNWRELQKLNELASEFDFQIYPRTYKPTYVKSLPFEFGISWMLDIVSYYGFKDIFTKVIPGIYPGKDHDTLLVFIQ